jgi:alpha-L-arabinofuranosidase
VRYANIEKGYNIRFWSIGNEPNLFPDYTIDQLNTEWRAIAEAMEAVDPSILLIGPELNQYADSTEPSYLDDLREWLRGFLEVNGDMVDYVSVHRYPFPKSISAPKTEISDMRENVPRWATLVELLRQDIRDTLGHDMPIAITEANSNYDNVAGSDTSPDSYYNAIWWSAVFSTLIRERVDMVNYFVLSAQQGHGLVDRYEPRPTYYTYQLFRDFGTMQVSSESSDQYVTVVAALREDGALTLVITNLYEEARSITLNGIAISSINEMRVLTPELLAETVDPATYFDGTVLQMPAQSAIRLVITVDS